MIRDSVAVNWTQTLHDGYYGNLWLSLDSTTEDERSAHGIRCLSFEPSQSNTHVIKRWTLSFAFPFVAFEKDSEADILLLLEVLDSIDASSLVTLRYDVN